MILQKVIFWLQSYHGWAGSFCLFGAFGNRMRHCSAFFSLQAKPRLTQLTSFYNLVSFVSIPNAGRPLVHSPVQGGGIVLTMWQMCFSTVWESYKPVLVLTVNYVTAKASDRRTRKEVWLIWCTIFRIIYHLFSVWREAFQHYFSLSTNFPLHRDIFQCWLSSHILKRLWRRVTPHA